MRVVWIVGLVLAAGCRPGDVMTTPLRPAPNTCQTVTDIRFPSYTVCWGAEGKPIGMSGGRDAVPAVVAPPVIIRK